MEINNLSLHLYQARTLILAASHYKMWEKASDLSKFRLYRANSVALMHRRPSFILNMLEVISSELQGQLVKCDICQQHQAINRTTSHRHYSITCCPLSQMLLLFSWCLPRQMWHICLLLWLCWLGKRKGVWLFKKLLQLSSMVLYCLVVWTAGLHWRPLWQVVLDAVTVIIHQCHHCTPI